MSLINEALRKAQRSGQTPPPPSAVEPRTTSAGTEPVAPAAIPASSPQASNRTLLMVVAVALVVAIFGSATAIVISVMGRPEGSTPALIATVQPPSPATAPAEASAPPSRPPATPPPNAPAPQASSTTAPAPAPLTTTQSSNPAPRPPPPATTPAPAAPPVSPASPTAAPTPAANAAGRTSDPTPVTATDRREAVTAYLQGIEVRGVLSGASRVLLYDQTTRRSSAYRVGALVVPDFGVRIREITPATITFVDENGVSYVKHF